GRDCFEFRCRKCYEISYESSRTNRHTCGGLFYYMNRLLKLINKREKIPRLFYRGKATNKYRTFIIDYLALAKSIDRPVRKKAEAMMLNRANGNLTTEQEFAQFI
ncbi:MAG: hypothetical protein Q8P20_03265, partial [bacterium]|nr:hypothetical protein [bacterium]